MSRGPWCSCGHAYSSHRDGDTEERCVTCGCASFDNREDARMQSDDDEPTPTQPGTPQTAAQIRRLIRFSIGDDYPLLALLVDLEMALRAEARAARLAEVRAAVERSGALHFTRAAVLAILSDTPETP